MIPKIHLNIQKYPKIRQITQNTKFINKILKFLIKLSIKINNHLNINNNNRHQSN